MSTFLGLILTIILSYSMHHWFNKTKIPTNEMWKNKNYSRRNHKYQTNPAFAELEEAEYEIIE